MSSETKQILTTDGIPLEVSLKKAERRNIINDFLVDAEYWADNGTELGEQWEAMKASIK